MEPREKAALLPESPGVYLFKDAGGTVLYVGKARVAAQPRAFLFSRIALGRRQNRLARPRNRRSRNHSRRQRTRSSGPRTQSHQAVPAQSSTSSCATTRPIRTSSSPPPKNIPASISRAASRKTARSILVRTFPPAWRAASSILFTSAFWFLRAPSISPAAIRARVCSTTSSAASDLASPASPPTSATPKRRAMSACFSKAAATT